LKDLTIAIYSTSYNEKDISEAFKEGADIYIRKPNDFSSLRKIMEKVVLMDWENHRGNLSRNSFLFQA
jgi:CheY-like chemotaxis protein